MLKFLIILLINTIGSYYYIYGAQGFSIVVIILCSPLLVIFIKKNFHKNSFFDPLIVSILMVIIFIIESIILSVIYDWQIENTKSKSTLILSALNQYYHEIGQYPESLSKLIPDYIDMIPSSSVLVPNNKFYYSRIGNSIYSLKFYTTIDGAEFFQKNSYNKNWQYDDGW